MTKPRLFIVIAIAIVAALAGLLLARSLQHASGPSLAAATLLQPPRAMPPFSLLDTRTKPYANAQLQGHWSLLFFGFTACPDVCPTTMALLAQVQSALADLPPAQKPQVVFISIDPRRDTPEKLAAYLHFFSPDFVGLTGEQAQLDALTKSLGVPVIVHPLENGAYTLDHSSAIFMIDPKGRLRALFSAPHTVAALSADIRSITAQ